MARACVLSRSGARRRSEMYGFADDFLIPATRLTLMTVRVCIFLVVFFFGCCHVSGSYQFACCRDVGQAQTIQASRRCRV